MHGMNEEEVDPLQSLIIELLEHSKTARRVLRGTTMPVFDRDGLQFPLPRRRAGSAVRLPARPGRRPEPAVRRLSARPPASACSRSTFARHGQTHPLGDPSRLTIATLADDLIAFLDHLEIDQAVIGGISLGSAVAVNVALRYPDRVLGLVLCGRPGSMDRCRRTCELYATIARLIRDLGPQAGLERFREIARVSGDGTRVAGLRPFAHRPVRAAAGGGMRRAARATVQRYACADREALRQIWVPTLILGNRQDPIHPWPLAQTLAELIPGAVLREITPKSVSPEPHAADVAAGNRRVLDDAFSEKRITPC